MVERIGKSFERRRPGINSGPDEGKYMERVKIICPNCKKKVEAKFSGKTCPECHRHIDKGMIVKR